MKKYAIVTGAYGAIGKAISLGIAKDKDIELTIIGRNEKKLSDLAITLIGLTDNQTIDYKVVDLGFKSSIIEFAKGWNQPLDILINNAATTPRQRTETTEGIETQWATNVLGYYYMMKYLSLKMEQRKDARIVNVASYWAGGLNLEDVEFKYRRYDNNSAYRQSKQANRMLSTKFSELLKEKKIAVNACHPGEVNSKLSNDLGFGGHETPELGADTPVWLALSDEVKGITGKYFEYRKLRECHFSKDRHKLEELFELCEGY